MNNVEVNNQNLEVKEYKGHRVVTFKDIDLVHNRPNGTAKRNFISNKKYLIYGEDYFTVNKNELGTKFVSSYGFGKNASKGTLITESGYLMIAKSLTDDLAWRVQRELVNNYFRNKADYGLTNQNKEIKQKEINHENLNKAYEQSTFIANIMNEAGVSGKEKLQAVKNIYRAMGINLFEQTNDSKSKVDFEIGELIKQLASELTEKQCKLKILEINKNKTISDKIRFGSMYVYVQALNLIQKKYMNKFLLD